MNNLKQLNDENLKVGFDGVYARWRLVHIIIASLFVVFVTLFEIITYIYDVENTINLPYGRATYVRMFIVTPLILCSFVLFLDIAVEMSKLSSNFKNYFISINCMSFCFVYSLVHQDIISVTAGFFIPLVLSVIYGDVKMTTIIYLSSCVLAIITSSVIYDASFTRDESYIFNVAAVILVLTFAYFFSIIIIRYEMEKKLSLIYGLSENKKIKNIMTHDTLSGAYNMNYLKEHLYDLYNSEKSNLIYTIAALKIVPTNGDSYEDPNKINEYSKILNQEIVKNIKTCILSRYDQVRFIVFNFGPIEVMLRKLDDSIKEISNDEFCIEKCYVENNASEEPNELIERVLSELDKENSYV